jgi:hypothetical protein
MWIVARTTATTAATTVAAAALAIPEMRGRVLPVENLPT